MATKNLVPRGDSEGKLGLNSRKWLEVNAVSGSFTTLSTNNLLNIDGQDLLSAGDGITITNDTENSRIVIASSGNNTALSDRIFEGDEGLQTSVETINTTNPEENKISFSISGDEKWFIDSDGHMLPKVNPIGNVTYNLGSIDNLVNKIFVENDGINFKTNGVPESLLNITSDAKPQFGVKYNGTDYDYDNILVSKQSVRVATTENLDYTYDQALQTLTPSPSVDSLIIDDITVNDNDRILIKNQTVDSQNGIYTVTGVGSSIVLTRSRDLALNSKFNDISVVVLEGTENSQNIFLTVSDTNGNSTTGEHELKWVSIVGGGGLEAVFDDKAPVLGGDLKVGSFDIISENSDSIDLISSKGSTNGYEAGLTLNSGLGTPNITFKSTTTQPPQLLLETPDKKKIRIAGVSDPFFTDQSITGQEFEYAFRSNLTSTEVNAGRAWFATQGWVQSQGYVTDLSNYVIDSTDSTPSLGSITILNEPENQQDWEPNNVVTKGYVDSVLQGIDEVLEPVRVATPKGTTAPDYFNNIDLAFDAANPLVAGTSIDGVSLSVGDRVLVKNQTNASENGVYVVGNVGVGGTPVSGQTATARATDLTTGDQANAVFVFVEEGSNASTGFLCTSPSGSDVVGTDDLTFVKMSSATEITVSDTSALTKTGNALSVNVDDTTLQIIDNNLKIKTIPSEAVNLDSFAVLTDPISDDDRFIITDASSTPDAHVAKKGTASLIKDYIRTDITSAIGDVQFSLPVAPATVMTVEAQNSLITDKVEVLDGSDPVSLADDDYLLYSDTSNSSNLKKVKYSTIKNNISTSSSFNINSLTLTDEDDPIVNGDFFAYYDASGEIQKKISLSNLKNVASSKLKVVFSNDTDDDLTTQAEANTHFILRQESSGNWNLNLSGVTGSDGDIVKISMLPYSITYLDDDLEGTDKYHTSSTKISITSGGRIFTYGIQDYDIIFIYINGTWFPSNTKWKGKIFGIEFNTQARLNAYTQDQTIYSWNEAICNINSSEIQVNVRPPASALNSGLVEGDSRTLYFTSPSITSIQVKCPNGIYESNSSDTSNRGDEIIFKFEASKIIKKVKLNLLRHNDIVMWFVECGQALTSSAEPFSLPTPVDPEEKYVVGYDADGNAIATQVNSLRIANSAVTTDKISNLNVTGDKIAANAVGLNKVSKPTKNAVALGMLSNSFDENNPDDYQEIDIITDLGVLADSINLGEVEESDHHTKLATAKAVIDFATPSTGGLNISVGESSRYYFVQFDGINDVYIPANVINEGKIIVINSTDYINLEKPSNVTYTDHRARIQDLFRSDSFARRKYNTGYFSDNFGSLISTAKIYMPPIDSVVNDAVATFYFANKFPDDWADGTYSDSFGYWWRSNKAKSYVSNPARLFTEVVWTNDAVDLWFTNNHLPKKIHLATFPGDSDPLMQLYDHHGKEASGTGFEYNTDLYLSSSNVTSDNFEGEKKVAGVFDYYYGSTSLSDIVPLVKGSNNSAASVANSLDLRSHYYNMGAEPIPYNIMLQKSTVTNNSPVTSTSIDFSLINHNNIPYQNLDEWNNSTLDNGSYPRFINWGGHLISQGANRYVTPLNFMGNRAGKMLWGRIFECKVKASRSNLVSWQRDFFGTSKYYKIKHWYTGKIGGEYYPGTDNEIINQTHNTAQQNLPAEVSEFLKTK